MGPFWIVDNRCLDQLVGWKGLSGLDMVGMDIRGLGLQCAVDLMDCVFCNHYSDGYIYDDDDGEWRWDQRHNWDDI